MRKYGLTIESFEAMLAVQGHVCPICGEALQSTGRGTHVDHCHTTGQIRNVLCKGCNVGLGSFGDNPDRLERAAKYIREWALNVSKK